MNKYYYIEEMIDTFMERPYSTACKNVLIGYADKINKSYGSVHNHQSWAGGYRDHITETMNIAIMFHEVMSSCRQLEFKLSQALFILFWHDIEKPWKYEYCSNGTLQHILPLATKEQAKLFRETLLQTYDLKLTPEEMNALTYVEGEFGDYSPTKRVMGPLAAFCHLCDVTSARIWPAHPKQNDSWKNAGRSFQLDVRK